MGSQCFFGFLALSVVPLLSGCEPAGYWDGVPPPQKLETTERAEEVVFDLTGTGTITDSSMARLRLVVGEEMAYGQVSVQLAVPSSADPSLSSRLLGALAGLGVSADRIRFAVSAMPAAEGVVVMQVRAIQLTAPDCAGVPTASTGDTTPLSMRRYQFGCASARNFAAMLADPRDLTAPPARVPGDGYLAEQAIQAMHGRYGPAAQKKQDSTSLNAGASLAGTASSASSSPSTTTP